MSLDSSDKESNSSRLRLWAIIPAVALSVFICLNAFVEIIVIDRDSRVQMVLFGDPADNDWGFARARLYPRITSVAIPPPGIWLAWHKIPEDLDYFFRFTLRYMLLPLTAIAWYIGLRRPILSTGPNRMLGVLLCWNVAAFVCAMVMGPSYSGKIQPDWLSFVFLAVVAPLIHSYIRRRQMKRRRRDPLICPICNYNLFGNVSGECPECGTPTPLSAGKPTP